MAEVGKRKAEGEKNLELGELSDEDLEEVAGGAVLPQSHTVGYLPAAAATVGGGGGCQMGKW